MTSNSSPFLSDGDEGENSAGKKKKKKKKKKGRELILFHLTLESYGFHFVWSCIGCNGRVDYELVMDMTGWLSAVLLHSGA